MKTNHQKKTPTSGESIASYYATSDRKKTEGMVRLAVNAHPGGLRGNDRFAILEPGADTFFHSNEYNS